MSNKGHASKIVILQQRTGCKHCYWKSRNAPWWQCEGFDACMNDIKVGVQRYHEKFQIMLTNVKEVERCKLLDVNRQIKHFLVEELTDKYSYQFTIPYSAAGIFYDERPGGSVELARNKGIAACNEYDQICAQGNRTKLNDITHEIFSPATRGREGLDAFNAGAINSLRDAPCTYVKIQPIALQAMTGRAIERIHGQIKRVGATSKHVSPPFVCGQMRLSSNISRLSRDVDFWRFCEASWRSNTLLSSILRETPKDELQSMSRTEKIKEIYQCTLQAEHRNTTDAKRMHAEWQLAIADQHPRRLEFGSIARAGVGYLRSILLVGGVYSIPKALFSKLIDRSVDVDRAAFAGMESIEAVMELIDAPSGDLEGVNLSELTFFEIIHHNDGRRCPVPLPHTYIQDDEVSVNRFGFVSAHTRRLEVTLHRVALTWLE